MDTGGLHYLELSEVAELIRSQQVSSVEVTQSQIERIRGAGAHLNAYIEVTEGIALKQAETADAEIARGAYKGPLHGVPVALKDICDMEGVATTAAMPLRKNMIAQSDATVTRRLREAGAVILGKLNMAEGAYGEHLEPYGPMVNPWDHTIWPGASSGGSGVAAAAGLCYGAVASDTGGSIRIPSAANGVTGLKPTWGRVSRHGIFELAATLDHIGPICRSARDAGIMLNAMAGYDPLDPTSAQRPVPNYIENLSSNLSGLRIGIDREWVSEKVEADTTVGVFETVEVLKSLGAKIVDIVFPDPDQIIWDWFEICGPQTAYAHRETYPSRKNEYGTALARQIDQGLDMSAVRYQEALLRREAFTGRVQALFANVDLLICPAVGCRIPSWEQLANIDNDMIYDFHRFTCTFTMARNPTITMPSGKGDTHIPTVVQLVGPHFGEERLVQAGHAFQSVTEWHQMHPLA